MQQGAAGAQPEAPQARSQVRLGAAGAQPAAPQGRTRGAAGVQPAQRVPQGALSDKLRRTSETNKKTGSLPYQEKTLLSLIRLRSISPDAKACAEKQYFSKHTRALKILRGLTPALISIRAVGAGRWIRHPALIIEF